MDIGPGELVIVLVVLLVMFGGARLPELARSLGQAHTELRRGLRDGERDDLPGHQPRRGLNDGEPDDIPGHQPRPPTQGGDDAR